MKLTPFRALPASLRADDVHVWIVPLDGTVHVGAETEYCLSDAERERLRRLPAERDRRRFAVTRTALRQTLARYTGRAGASIELHRGERGKPALHAGDIHFSLSHSADLALIAVSRHLVGVDVEHPRTLRHPDRTASRILHADTVGTLDRLDEAERSAAFLDAWTQREAHVKALGGGLFHTPDTLPFKRMTPNGEPVLLLDRVTGEPWVIARFEPAPGARASLAVHAAAATIHYLTSEEPVEEP